MTISQMDDDVRKLEPVIVRKTQLEGVPSEQFQGPGGGNVTWKTILSSPTTKSNTFTVGIASCPPNGGYLALHRHVQPEIYHIISGAGIVRVDGHDHNVSDGDVVFIPGNSEHGVFNENERDELRWLYCFNVDRFEDIVYDFMKGGKSTDVVPTVQ